MLFEFNIQRHLHTPAKCIKERRASGARSCMGARIEISKLTAVFSLLFSACVEFIGIIQFALNLEHAE